MDCHRKGKKQSYEGTTVEMPTGFRSARNPARSGPRNPNRLCRAVEAKSARSSRGFRNIGPIAISMTPSASKLSHRPTGASGPWAPRASRQEAADTEQGRGTCPLHASNHAAGWAASPETGARASRDAERNA